jgi:hypothetical protein
MRIIAHAPARALLLATVIAAMHPSGAQAEAELGADPPAALEAAKPDEGSVLLLPPLITQDAAGTRVTDEEANAFGKALEDALGRALSAENFRVVESTEALEGRRDLAAQASARALGAGVRWVSFADLGLSEKRIAYTLRVYDAAESALAAAASFSTYAGLSSLPLMEDSAKSAAAKAAAYRAALAGEGGKPVQYRITLNSPDEGASVFIGPAGKAGSLAVGTIEGGALQLPYLPFAVGTKIVIGLSARGRRALEIPVELGEEAPTLEAHALSRIDRENLILGTGPGRLLGLGATYRYFLKSEWSFYFLNDRLFAGYDFQKASKPVLHLEAWEGLGSYLVLPPSSRFRLGACVGGGFLFTHLSGASSAASSAVFVDLALMPVEAFFEYRPARGPTYCLSMRGAYSLSSSGLLGRGWIGNGGPDLTLGLLWGR